jgi:hypothetical protein
MIKTSFRSEFVTAAREAPRLFFAPLVGAIQAVRKKLAAHRPNRTRKGRTPAWLSETAFLTTDF